MAPILPFSSTETTLETAGGKGANLARLARSGFPVLRGFIIPTAAYRLFHATSAAALARLALDGALPPAAQTAVDHFLARYGMRGVGEIDMGRSRWREDPTPVMQSLKSYLHIEPQRAPDALFARGAQSAQAAVEQLAAIVRRRRGGWLKEKVVRFLARRLRIFMGLRQSPKFCIIRAMGPARAALLEIGQAFVAAGTLDPHGAQLAPGEILVCPGADPAWTPLFMAAGGLITEVRGMMTHGSVVAREVGIPAVVGVHRATRRLKNGQNIRLDGSTGQIVVLDRQ